MPQAPNRNPQNRVPNESIEALIAQGRVAFGCGRLHHIWSPAARQQLLRRAIDGGLRRLDVAPSYGNGLCERAIGQALKSTRDDVRVNTKVGIPVSLYPPVADWTFPVFRAVDLLSRNHQRAYMRRDFRPCTLRASLEGSLRRLGISRIDTYFLHEPKVMLSRTEWDEVLVTMLELHSEGKIRAWGLAGPCRHFDLAALRSDLPFVLQTPFAELDSSPAPLVHERLAFGLYSAFGAQPSPGSFAEFIGSSAERFPDASFIVSTTDAARLTGWVAGGRA
jgi:D-threo-aldose 1-dehydrogenase